jgi:TATA-box binding protein (TBP) (component of TFIID and TFIIIB)
MSIINSLKEMSFMDDELDMDWDNFCNDVPNQNNLPADEIFDENYIPKSSAIYISTKTKISYLSQEIDLRKTFWKLKISPYHTVDECIIKKQMKFNSFCEEEIEEIKEYLINEKYCEEHIITRIVNPEGRIKYKDIRKISVGLCKKDILSYRTKKKSAFYNCFVVILRVLHEDKYREIHVKVFNTGKLEIPGIQTDELLIKVLNLLIKFLKEIVDENIIYQTDKNETVLINSNFNCGFFINREKLHSILKYKYNINSGYDPCSYPGIQCKFYHNSEITVQNGQQPINHDYSKYNKISFMIFRTGSVLIVGKCEEDMLTEVYEFIKKLLMDEYKEIHGHTQINTDIKKNEVKKRKIRRKTMSIE